MAANQIPIDTSKVNGSVLWSFRNNLASLKAEAPQLLAKMTACIDGSDYSQLEAQFGIPTGKGAAAYNEFNSAVGKLLTDASVSNVSAAIDQLLAFLG